MIKIKKGREMDILRILIGNDIPDQGMLWANTFKSAGAFAVTRKSDGPSLLQYIKDSIIPDVIIIEAKMPGLDAIGFIKELKKLGKLPVVIVTADYEMVSVREEAIYLGAGDFLVKPFDVNKLIRCISDAGQRIGAFNTDFGILKEKPSIEDLEYIVTDIMRLMGIPANLKGYYYLRYAIMVCVDNTDMLTSVTRLLYPTVAARFKTTPTRVERALRSVIELVWEKGDTEVLNTYFGHPIRNTGGKPSNSEFIALISDELRIRMKTSGRMIKL